MKISESCYAVQGLYFIPPWSVNAGIVAGNNKTLVIDTGSNVLSAQTIYGYAQAIDSSNQIEVLNTEKHLDHMGGNSFFHKQGITIYGHKLINRDKELIHEYRNSFNSLIENRVRREKMEGSVILVDTEITNPDNPINSEITLELGGINVDIIMTPGHTPTNLSAFISTEGVLYSGDCIVNKLIPNLEEGSPEEWRIWKVSLERIKKLSPEFIIPGHGEVITGKKRLLEEIERIDQILDRAIETGAAPTAV